MTGNLEGRVGKVKINLICTHRAEHAISYYSDRQLEARACLCVDCMPRYKRLVEGYRQARDPEEDGFDEEGMYFKNE